MEVRKEEAEGESWLMSPSHQPRSLAAMEVAVTALAVIGADSISLPWGFSYPRDKVVKPTEDKFQRKDILESPLLMLFISSRSKTSKLKALGTFED